MSVITLMMWTAALASAMAAWIWMAPAPFRRPEPTRENPNAGAALTVELLRVAIGQGSSLPEALIAVGETLEGDEGQRMAGVGRSLNRGVRWHTAWRRATSHSPREPTNLLALLEDALESSWTHGVAPTERLKLTAEQIDRDALSAIEREASRLSVRLLMPTGLCFLPAFVAIGVVPAIASFAW